MGSAYYCYDLNGNMTDRQATNAACDSGGQQLTYDAENRLTQVVSGTIATGYKYDGDGARVSKTITVSGVTTTTFYIGSHFEITSTGGQTGITKYYYFGAQRVAMRQGSSVTYLHSDHLGSSNVASNGSGALISRQTYFPFGAPRASDTAQMTAVTDFGFTGQKLDASDGLMYYNARYYDAGLGRFISADTIVPDSNTGRFSTLTVSFARSEFVEELGRENRRLLLASIENGMRDQTVLWSQSVQPPSPGSTRSSGPGNPQNLNRYSYVRNNPMRYTDPTGHWTFGIGFGFTGGALFGWSGSVMLVFDDNANVGVAFSGGPGSMLGVSVGVGLQLQGTDADTIDLLNGAVEQTGGSATIGIVSVGYEGVQQTGPDGQPINGGNLNIGLSPPFLPPEVHNMKEDTVVYHVGPTIENYEDPFPIPNTDPLFPYY